jgi:hypothetical protein
MSSVAEFQVPPCITDCFGDMQALNPPEAKPNSYFTVGATYTVTPTGTPTASPARERPSRGTGSNTKSPTLPAAACTIEPTAATKNRQAAKKKAEPAVEPKDQPATRYKKPSAVAVPEPAQDVRVKTWTKKAEPAASSRVTRQTGTTTAPRASNIPVKAVVRRTTAETQKGAVEVVPSSEPLAEPSCSDADDPGGGASPASPPSPQLASPATLPVVVPAEGSHTASNDAVPAPPPAPCVAEVPKPAPKATRAAPEAVNLRTRHAAVVAATCPEVTTAAKEAPGITAAMAKQIRQQRCKKVAAAPALKPLVVDTAPPAPAPEQPIPAMAPDLSPACPLAALSPELPKLPLLSPGVLPARPEMRSPCLTPCEVPVAPRARSSVRKGSNTCSPAEIAFLTQSRRLAAVLSRSKPVASPFGDITNTEVQGHTPTAALGTPLNTAEPHLSKIGTGRSDIGMTGPSKEVTAAAGTGKKGRSMEVVGHTATGKKGLSQGGAAGATGGMNEAPQPGKAHAGGGKKGTTPAATPVTTGGKKDPPQRRTPHAGTNKTVPPQAGAVRSGTGKGTSQGTAPAGAGENALGPATTTTTAARRAPPKYVAVQPAPAYVVATNPFASTCTMHAVNAAPAAALPGEHRGNRTLTTVVHAVLRTCMSVSCS